MKNKPVLCLDCGKPIESIFEGDELIGVFGWCRERIVSRGIVRKIIFEGYICDDCANA